MHKAWKPARGNGNRTPVLQIDGQAVLRNLPLHNSIQDVRHGPDLSAVGIQYWVPPVLGSAISSQAHFAPVSREVTISQPYGLQQVT